MQAILALEDGKVFRGKGYGAKGECYGEVVFNTSITGYQEIFTDPSYAGQIVVLTNPQIGNYGTNTEDNEATRPYIEGLIVREFSKVSSNWRSQQVAEEYLEQFKIPVLADVDTRALVRHLRDHGVMRALGRKLGAPHRAVAFGRAPLDDQQGVVAQDRAQPLFGVGDGPRRRDDVGFQPVHPEIHDREEQILLALHVMIDAGFGDAHGLGDVAHRGRVIAFVAEYLRRHVIDLIEAIGFFR